MSENLRSKHVFLIDGSGFIFRAFHGVPPMTRKDGTPVNAVFGFTKMIMKLVEDTNANYIAVIFDQARKTFRNDIYPKYKANRPPPPDELIPQFELVREATRALNIPAISKEGFEADDIIATYAKKAYKAGAKVTIVSSDKDLMQLVNDRISMFDAMKNRFIGVEQVLEKFGVRPEKVVEVQALAGDSSDNVPGVSGIGIKTAALLLQEYGNLESLLKRATEIKQPKRRQSLIDNADMARISLNLVSLRDDVPMDKTLSDFAVNKPNIETLLSFLDRQGFKSLIGPLLAKNNLLDQPTELKKNSTPNYQLVQTIEELARWVKKAEKHGIVGVDTETTGLNVLLSELVGISLSLRPGTACYIPLNHKLQKTQGTFQLLENHNNISHEEIKQIPLREALTILKPMLENPGILKVGQNIKFDSHIFARKEICLSPIEDTMLLSYCLDGGLHRHGMDELAENFLGFKTIKFKEIVGSGKNQITFDYVPLKKALKYAAEDADITLRLYNFLKPRLINEKMVSIYELIERPLIKVLETIEANGIEVDAKELKRLSNDFTLKLNTLAEEIFILSGCQFNIASPKQLGEILFEKMKIKGGKKTKTGAYGTGADILEKLVLDGHELPGKILRWRQLAKLKSTYTDALISQINPNTGRVHTSFSQAVTSTGRLSSTDPNLQNIPIKTEEGRQIRRAFITRPGYKLLSADYSQIELRLLAHIAEIESLKKAFHDGKDIHAITASQVFNVSLEKMTPTIRRQAKAINFGIIYGISAFGLAKQLAISNSEAAQYITAYFERYPGIQKYMEITKKTAAKFGFVSTLFGRKCHIRSINDKNPNIRGMAERAAINAPIQGGAADIIKLAMVRLPSELSKNHLSAKMLLQVHDELIFEVKEQELDNTKHVVRQTMEDAASLDVPLVVDIGIGDNWDEAH